MSDSATPWAAAHQLLCASSSPRVCPSSCPVNWWCRSKHLILCFPLLLLPSVFPSVRVFSSELVLHIQVAKCWSFSFSISPCSECSGLISFRIDRFVLPAVQGTLKSLLPHHSSKSSVLQFSVFFIVQLSHPCMTTGKTVALTYLDLYWQSNVSAFKYVV